jgi:hypothetical protein
MSMNIGGVVIKVDTSGFDALNLRLSGLARKVEVAKVAALNDAGRAGYQATTDEIKRVFDRPTPWIQRSVRYTKATAARPVTRIDFDAWGNKTNVTAGQVLNAEIYGGNRRMKRHEVALQRVGVLPAGMAIVPGPAAKLDQYGNMSGAQIVQIISWFQGFEQYAGARQNMTDKRKRALAKDKKNGARGFSYFVLWRPHGKLRPGIYQRFEFSHGSAVKPVMFFVQTPKYGVRLDFYKIAERAALAEFKSSFDRYCRQFLSERII